MSKMLIVDDDIHLRKLVLTYAQLEDFQCSEAGDSRQALELLARVKAVLKRTGDKQAETSLVFQGFRPAGLRASILFFCHFFSFSKS